MEIRIFGESHAPEIGVEIEGVPKETVIDVAELQAFLDCRALGNGQGGMSTPRKEPDKVEFESGVVNGVATGFRESDPNGGVVRRRGNKGSELIDAVAEFFCIMST